MRRGTLTYRLMTTVMMVLCGVMASAQELEVKINLNTQQIERTDKTVFDNLQQTLEQWMNDRQWTELQFQKHERITVNFNLTVTKYDPSSNLFECTALIQANRPVFNATYNSTLYNNKDAHKASPHRQRCRARPSSS